MERFNLRMTKTDHIECLGYPIFNGSLTDLPTSEKLVVNTLNQYSFCIAEKDRAFKESLQKSDILLPDGVGIIMAARMLHGIRIKKIAGADLHKFLLKRLNKNGGSCFYMGSSKKTLRKIRKRTAKKYPNISIGTYSPPFKPEFSEADNTAMIAAVNTFKPDVLFVGMTAPKQEKWSHAHQHLLEAGMICSVGAVFDFYAGTMKRPGKRLINLGLEWFGRLLKEPKRMWKRYIYYGVIFARHLLKEKFSGSKKQ